MKLHKNSHKTKIKSHICKLRAHENLLIELFTLYLFVLLSISPMWRARWANPYPITTDAPIFLIHLQPHNDNPSNATSPNLNLYKSTLSPQSSSAQQQQSFLPQSGGSTTASSNARHEQHQLINLINPNLLFNQQLLGQGFSETTPFNLLQNMAAVGSGGALLDAHNSMDLSQKKRKLSESSDNELNDFKSMNKKYKGDQFEFLYNYFMQNEQNEELKKQDKNSMDFDVLFQYYQMSELKKKGGNFDYLYQYYLQNEKNQKQLGSPTLHNSKSPGLDAFGGEKPSFDFLLQYYQVNESKKFLQDSVSQIQEPKANINQTTAIMKQMLSLIQKQQRSAAAMQTNPHFKQQANEPQARPTSVSLASTASMESLNEQSAEVFNTSGTGISSSRSPDRSATAAAASTEKQSNKRLRTTILPEQLNFLYECYQNESNPSRKMLEEISKKVNLKKRVVQVRCHSWWTEISWFHRTLIISHLFFIKSTGLVSERARQG